MHTNQLKSNEENETESWFFENNSKDRKPLRMTKTGKRKGKKKPLHIWETEKETSLQTLQMEKDYYDHLHTINSISNMK